jgi:hypothetical protein
LSAQSPQTDPFESYQQKEEKYFWKKLWRIVGNFVTLRQSSSKEEEIDEIYRQHRRKSGRKRSRFRTQQFPQDSAA